MIRNLKKLLFEEFLLLLVVAFVSAAILHLPSMHQSDLEYTFIDSLFTATSALTVTGLIVRPTGSFFTPAGKALILFLIELGGLGIVTLTSFFQIALLKKTPNGISNISNVKELSSDWNKIPNILFFALKFTLIAQIIGFLFYWLVSGFSPFDALFHSISAFNNAGFSTFDGNLVGFSTNIKILLPTILLLFFGGIGFLVVSDIFSLVTSKNDGLSIYSKIVLELNFVLYSVSFVLLFTDLIMHGHESFTTSIWEGLFQSFTFRTAGFNTIDVSNLGILGILTALGMMIIGGGSISMAGGIKTSSFYVFFKSIISHLRGETKIIVNRHSFYIPKILVETSLFITVTYLFVFTCSLTLLAIVEDTSKLSLSNLAFEVVSALSTVGLSLNTTALLNTPAKTIIIFDMIVGRLGVYLIFRRMFSNARKWRKLRQLRRKVIKLRTAKEKLDELEIAVG